MSTLKEIMGSNYLGNMCVIDNKIVWCSCSEEVFTLLLGDMAILAMTDNSIIKHNNDHCELEGRCFNFECPYNKDGNISVYREILDHEFDEVKIDNIRKNLKGFTKEIKEDETDKKLDEELIHKLNTSSMVINVFDWGDEFD